MFHYAPRIQNREKPTHLQKFQPNKVEPLLLKSLDDLPHKPPLDAVRFDGNEGALAVGHGPADRQTRK